MTYEVRDGVRDHRHTMPCETKQKVVSLILAYLNINKTVPFAVLDSFKGIEGSIV